MRVDSVVAALALSTLVWLYIESNQRSRNQRQSTKHSRACATIPYAWGTQRIRCAWLLLGPFEVHVLIVVVTVGPILLILKFLFNLPYIGVILILCTSMLTLAGARIKIVRCLGNRAETRPFWPICDQYYEQLKQELQRRGAKIANMKM